MKEEKITLSFPVDRPLKKKEKEKVMTGVITSFGKVVDFDVRIEDCYYVEKRAMPGLLTLVIVIGVVADIFAIALGVREFLKHNKDFEHVSLRTKSLDLRITGNMSDETILEIVREGRRIVEEER